MKRFSTGALLCVNLCGLIFGYLGSVEATWADSFLLNPDGTFSIVNVPGASSTDAFGINNAGEISGSFSDNHRLRGFLDANGVFTTIDSGAFSTSVAGINDEGQVVGSGHGVVHGFGDGFLYTNGTFATIDLPGFPVQDPSGINNAGQIVGAAFFSPGPFFCAGGGYLYDAGVFTTIQIPFLCGVTGINNAGEIIGTFEDSPFGRFHSFLDINGVFTTIDVPGAYATYGEGINDSGQIVGWFYSDSGQHGFLDTNGVFTTIDLPAATETFPTGINNRGQIVGTFTPSPEPASILLLGCGLAGIGLLVRRRRADRHPHKASPARCLRWDEEARRDESFVSAREELFRLSFPKH